VHNLDLCRAFVPGRFFYNPGILVFMIAFSLKKQFLEYREYLTVQSANKNRSIVESGKASLERFFTLPGFLLGKATGFFAPALIVVTIFFHFRLSSIYSGSYNFRPDLIEGWKVFRNLAYLLFVFQIPLSGVSDIVYFLRGKYDKVGQWIAPWVKRIVFVTFSYAIAGLFIDLIFMCVFVYAAVTRQSSDVAISFFERVMQ